MAQDINGTKFSDRALLGSGSQNFDGGNGNDRIISYADGGEPNSGASTDANDILTGGNGADTFEFRVLLNATTEVLAQHTNSNGAVNWTAVTGENDNWHDHWVEGIGVDTITDFSKDEGDKIVIKGHTATLKSIEYHSDDDGDYSLITLYSQQGNGGAAGANTTTGAHDEDSLGQIKVYGDQITAEDITLEAKNFGVDQLQRVDTDFGPYDWGVTQLVYSNSDDTSYTGILGKQADRVVIGAGSQEVNAGGGNDRIYSYSDGGEPDPAQTNGAEGRVNAAVAAGQSDDIISGGQGKDVFAFRLLLNAKEDILEEHTRSNGSINWRRVAGENDNVHDHWVEGIGNDVILDFSNQDGDKIDIRGHTVEIASITYGEDEQGDYSVIALRSQQGDGGGAHDEDALGTIKVYGDKVTEDDITLKAKVFYGVDTLNDIAANEAHSPANNIAPLVTEIQWSAANPEDIALTFTGTDHRDKFFAGSGSQTIDAGAGNDRIISLGDAGEPDPAQTVGSEGRVNPALSAAASDDVLTGGSGADSFEFHALLNARREVIEQHTNSRGVINWGGVAGENDNVHDHWVEGFGNDIITDYSLEDGDKIVLRGHTITKDSITYGTDTDGTSYSLITVYSQQGNGGAGGANTATGAHDEDPLGTIKVYGDRVEIDNIVIQKGGVVDGVDRLQAADRLAAYNGGTQYFESQSHGDTINTAPANIKTTDYIEIGAGSQVVNAGGGNDKLRIYADGGESDPAQTDGAEGRINAAIDPAYAEDIISGGQGRDQFTFNFLLNATEEVLARHTRADGSINWRRVAGENDNVHDHWVEGIGNDVLLDFSNQDGDKLILRGHTVEIASITYGEDDGGDYSLIAIRSQQGDGGGAHDEDALGTLKVYGDTLTEADITVKAAGVFDGIDRSQPFDDQANVVFGSNSSDALLEGSSEADIIHGGRGRDGIEGLAGDDFLFGDSSHDTINGGDGNDWVEGGGGRDYVNGGAGNDSILADSGRDFITGGTGSDSFLIGDGLRSATIFDWEEGLDRLDFSRVDSVEDFSDITVTQQNDNAYQLAYLDEDGDEIVIEVLSEAAFVIDATDMWF